MVGRGLGVLGTGGGISLTEMLSRRVGVASSPLNTASTAKSERYSVTHQIIMKLFCVNFLITSITEMSVHLRMSKYYADLATLHTYVH